MTPLYIIPARGGSKGIPHKNIKLLAGRPLIGYSIEAARRAGATDSHILVSTEDEEIAEIVERDCGLPVPYRRPAELATDTAGSREVILDAMDWADAAGINYDVVVLLQPTSPLRTADDISGTLNEYRPGVDMAVSVAPAPCNPYYDCFETDPADGSLHVSKGDGLITRRQDAPPVWVYNGAVYVINPVSLRKYQLGQLPVRVPYPMPASRSIDIDTPLDWHIAEYLISQGKSRDHDTVKR